MLHDYYLHRNETHPHLLLLLLSPLLFPPSRRRSLTSLVLLSLFSPLSPQNRWRCSSVASLGFPFQRNRDIAFDANIFQSTIHCSSSGSSSSSSGSGSYPGDRWLIRYPGRDVLADPRRGTGTRGVMVMMMAVVDRRGGSTGCIGFRRSVAPCTRTQVGQRH